MSLPFPDSVSTAEKVTPAVAFTTRSLTPVSDTTGTLLKAGTSGDTGCPHYSSDQYVEGYVFDTHLAKIVDARAPKLAIRTDQQSVVSAARCMDKLCCR